MAIQTSFSNELPFFVPNQILKADDLNKLVQFLDEQNRFTRSILVGAGINFGLEGCLLQEEAASDVGSDSCAKILLTGGLGLSSDGYMFDLKDCTLDYINKNEKISLNAFKCEHDENAPLLEAWELKTYDEILPTEHEFFKKMLFKSEVENLEENELGKCFASKLFEDRVLVLLWHQEAVLRKACFNECDSKGEDRRFFIRKLLLKKADYEDYIIGEAKDNVEAVFLKETAFIKRFGFDMTGQNKLDISAIKDWTIFKNNYRLICEQAIEQLGLAYQNAYDLFGFRDFEGNSFASLVTTLTELKVKVFEEDSPCFIQYFYDYLKDLVIAFQEFEAVVCGLAVVEDFASNRCAFPGFVSTGNLKLNYTPPVPEQENDEEEDEDNTSEDEKTIDNCRTEFTASPFLSSSQDNLALARCLYERMVTLSKTEHVVFPPVFEEEEEGDNVLHAGIKITACINKSAALADRPIPYYYQDETQVGHANTTPSAVRQDWNCRLTSLKKTERIAGYHQHLPVAPPFKDALLYDSTAFDFYRIEGHIENPNFETVDEFIAKIKELRACYHLSFDVLKIELPNAATDETETEIPLYQFEDLEHRFANIRADFLCELKDRTDKHAYALASILKQIHSFCQFVVCFEDFNLYYDRAFATSTTPSDNPNSSDASANPFSHLVDLYNERARTLNDQLFTEKFSGFAQENPGLEHLAGVYRGGTFVLVYTTMEDGTEKLVGDFCLPYQCCYKQKPAICELDPFVILPKEYCENDTQTYEVCVYPPIDGVTTFVANEAEIDFGNDGKGTTTLTHRDISTELTIYQFPDLENIAPSLGDPIFKQQWDAKLSAFVCKLIGYQVLVEGNPDFLRTRWSVTNHAGIERKFTETNTFPLYFADYHHPEEISLRLLAQNGLCSRELEVNFNLCFLLESIIDKFQLQEDGRLPFLARTAGGELYIVDEQGNDYSSLITNANPENACSPENLNWLLDCQQLPKGRTYTLHYGFPACDLWAKTEIVIPSIDMAQTDFCANDRRSYEVFIKPIDKDITISPNDILELRNRRHFFKPSSLEEPTSNLTLTASFENKQDRIHLQIHPLPSASFNTIETFKYKQEIVTNPDGDSSIKPFCQLIGKDVTFTAEDTSTDINYQWFIENLDTPTQARFTASFAYNASSAHPYRSVRLKVDNIFCEAESFKTLHLCPKSANFRFVGLLENRLIIDENNVGNVTIKTDTTGGIFELSSFEQEHVNIYTLLTEQLDGNTPTSIPLERCKDITYLFNYANLAEGAYTLSYRFPDCGLSETILFAIDKKEALPECPPIELIELRRCIIRTDDNGSETQRITFEARSSIPFNHYTWIKNEDEVTETSTNISEHSFIFKPDSNSISLKVIGKLEGCESEHEIRLLPCPERLIISELSTAAVNDFFIITFKTSFSGGDIRISPANDETQLMEMEIIQQGNSCDNDTFYEIKVFGKLIEESYLLSYSIKRCSLETSVIITPERSPDFENFTPKTIPSIDENITGSTIIEVTDVSPIALLHTRSAAQKSVAITLAQDETLTDNKTFHQAKLLLEAETVSDTDYAAAAKLLITSWKRGNTTRKQQYRDLLAAITHNYLDRKVQANPQELDDATSTVLKDIIGRIKETKIDATTIKNNWKGAELKATLNADVVEEYLKLF